MSGGAGCGNGDEVKHLEAWPRVEREQLAVCHFCDALHEAPAVEEGTAVVCSNCGSALYRNQPASLDRAVAFGMAALLLMVVAQGFPFISLSANGMVSGMTLTGASLSLAREGSHLLAAGVAFCTMIAPSALAAGLVYVCLPLRWGKAWPGARGVALWLYRLEPWAMVEVFFLGAVVSLLKLVKLADVSIGVAFWALGAVMFCLAAAIAGIDRRELWDRLEVALQK